MRRFDPDMSVLKHDAWNAGFLKRSQPRFHARQRRNRRFSDKFAIQFLLSIREPINLRRVARPTVNFRNDVFRLSPEAAKETLRGNGFPDFARQLLPTAFMQFARIDNHAIPIEDGTKRRLVPRETHFNCWSEGSP